MCKLDTQWRILVPSRLIKEAELKRDIMIVGNGDNIEIWDLDKWNEVAASLNEQISSLERSIYKTE